MLKIGVDAMGGDFAPEAAVQGAVLALEAIGPDSRIVSDSELAAVEARAGAQEHDGGEWAKLAALKERLEAEGPQEEDGTPEK